MTLRLSLIIDGDASGAKLTAEQAKKAITDLLNTMGAGVTVTDKSTKSTKETGEAAALSGNQIAELGHIARSTFGTMLAGGSVFQALGYEANRLVSVLTIGQGGVGGTLKSIGGLLSSIVTPGRLATGTLLAFGIAAATAASQYGAAQHDIQLALVGAGRASGLTAGDVNSAAQNGASTYGLSVPEARAFATELAATGKIGREQLTPLVAIGHDLAIVLGTDAKGAAAALGKAYSDPARGAVDLNQKLGFLDAGLLRHITNLQAQNKLYEAQAAITDRVKSSLDGVDQTLSTSTRFWTAIGNAISGGWDKLGEFASRATGIGLTKGLDEKIKATSDTIASLKKRIDEVGGAAIVNRGSTLDRLNKQLQDAEAEYANLTAASDRYWKSVRDAQDRQRSFAVAQAVNGVLPDIGQLDTLRNRETLLVDAMIQVAVSGGASSDKLKTLGLTYDQLSAAIVKTSAQLKSFRTEDERTAASLQLQIASVGVHAPQGLAELARQQFYQQQQVKPEFATPEQKGNADLAAMLALRQAQQSIIEGDRQQLLSAQQRVETAGLELQVLGQSGALHDATLAKLQTRQQLEQQALQIYGNRDAYDRAHLAALEKQIDAEGRIRQHLAEGQALRDAQFAREQIGRSSDEQSVASALRGVYGADYQNYTDGALAASLRLNQGLQQVHDTGLSFFTDINGNLRQGQTFWNAWANAGVNAVGKLANKFTELAFNQAFNAIFGTGTGGGGFGGLLSSIFGGGGGGGVSTGNIGGTAGGLPPLYAEGGTSPSGRWGISGEAGFELFRTEPGGGVTFFSNSQSRRMLGVPGFAAGGGFDGAGRIVGPPRLTGSSAASSAIAGGIHVEGSTVIVQGDASDRVLALMQDELDRRDQAFARRVVETVLAAKSRGVEGL